MGASAEKSSVIASCDPLVAAHAPQASDLGIRHHFSLTDPNQSNDDIFVVMTLGNRIVSAAGFRTTYLRK